MEKVKIKVSMELRKHAQFNSKTPHHQVWLLKQVRKNLRKGSILEGTVRPATPYSPAAVIINNTAYPLALFNILLP